MADENENPSHTLPSTEQEAPQASSSMAENETSDREQAPPDPDPDPEANNENPMAPEPERLRVTIEDNPNRYDFNPYPDQQIFTVTFKKNIRFFNVTVTSDYRAAGIWADFTLNQCRQRFAEGNFVAGFAVEGTPAVPASILTICAGRRCLIFQLERAESVPSYLMDFLNTVKLVGIQNNEIYKAELRASKHQINLEERQLVDLRQHGLFHGNNGNGIMMVNASCQEMVDMFITEYTDNIHVTLSDEITTSNWAVPNLSQDQVMHTSIKAIASYTIGNNLAAHQFFHNWDH